MSDLNSVVGGAGGGPPSAPTAAAAQRPDIARLMQLHAQAQAGQAASPASLGGLGPNPLHPALSMLKPQLPMEPKREEDVRKSLSESNASLVSQQSSEDRHRSSLSPGEQEREYSAEFTLPSIRSSNAHLTTKRRVMERSL